MFRTKQVIPRELALCDGDDDDDGVSGGCGGGGWLRQPGKPVGGHTLPPPPASQGSSVNVTAARRKGFKRWQYCSQGAVYRS